MSANDPATAVDRREGEAGTRSKPAYATNEDIRYAEALRLRLRRELLRDAPAAGPWWVGVD